MTPKSSPLNILDFALTKFDFKFIPPSEKDNVNLFFNKYEIDIDFFIDSNELLIVYMKADINKGDNPLPGYSFFAEATCVFQFDKKVKLDAELKRNLEGYSTLYIALNSLRGLISNITANAPLGRYMLPSIDLNDLIEKKKLQLSKSISSTNSKKALTKSPKKLKSNH